MVVPYKNSSNKDTLVFLRPLSSDLWFKSIILFLYTGVVVWLLEFLSNKTAVHRPTASKLGVTTFLSLFGDTNRVEHFLTRIVLIVWIFCFLLLGSSYTATLTTMMTIQQLNSNVTDLQELLKSGEYVGYRNGSYVAGLLEGLGFNKSNIKTYDTLHDLKFALSMGSKNGGITAYVHELPYIKLFLAKYGQGYTMLGPFYKTAGFGFALPKGSPLLGDISKAMLSIVEGETINQIGKKWIGYPDKKNSDLSTSVPEKLTTARFKPLFMLSVVVSTSSLLIAVMIYLYEKNNGQMSKMQCDKNGEGVEANDKRQDENGRCRVQENNRIEAGRNQNDKEQDETGSATTFRSERNLISRVAPISSSARY
ncbi:hypothetical protein QOZ80_6AG0535850 [Eleusine coracana subsp. coracana]|nr:hypothetical protein QOZ80_6AG0535850 [Eleusine coracana subsp. coracana]